MTHLARADRRRFSSTSAKVTQETSVLIDREMLIGIAHAVTDGAAHVDAAQCFLNVTRVRKSTATGNLGCASAHRGVTSVAQTTRIVHRYHQSRHARAGHRLDDLGYAADSIFDERLNVRVGMAIGAPDSSARVRRIDPTRIVRIHRMAQIAQRRRRDGFDSETGKRNGR